MLDLLNWAIRVAVATFVLLLIALLLNFVFNVLMSLFHGPALSYGEVTVIAAIVSIGGGWTFSLFRPPPA